VIHAAYNAFYSGLHAALYLSAFLVLAAGLFALVALRGRQPAEGDVGGRDGDRGAGTQPAP
jgi:hypothetical protein